MTRRTALYALLSLLLSSTLVLAQAKPNLSGEWVLNEAKSDFGRLPAPAKFVRKIEHNDPDLKMVTTQSGRRGEVTTELKYTTDGKECTNVIRGAEVKGTAKWEGDTLVINSKRELQGATIAFQERWTMSADGNTLSIATHITSPQGEADLKFVLEKQSK
jgi:hypothetical protein